MGTTKKPIWVGLLCEAHLKAHQTVPGPFVYIDNTKGEHPLCQPHYQEALEREVRQIYMEKALKERAARLNS